MLFGRCQPIRCQEAVAVVLENDFVVLVGTHTIDPVLLCSSVLIEKLLSQLGGNTWANLNSYSSVEEHCDGNIQRNT